ncbi:RNA 2'-phosphotransferase [compost metagenome]
MNPKLIVRTSKFLSYVLRHSPQSIGITLDSEGWTDIDQLILKAGEDGTMLSRELLKVVVETNEKKRFTIRDNMIRAAQGHSSAAVDIQHVALKPPDFLYHGTATRFMCSILEQGLTKQQRQHVHLSEDHVTAIGVGRRYGEVVLLNIDAASMYEEGHLFYQADNGVWLTDHVPAQFLTRSTMEIK